MGLFDVICDKAHKHYETNVQFYIPLNLESVCEKKSGVRSVKIVSGYKLEKP